MHSFSGTEIDPQHFAYSERRCYKREGKETIISKNLFNNAIRFYQGRDSTLNETKRQRKKDLL